MARQDAATFDDLYRRYAGDVYRFALYLSGDRATAEDIASETFVRVWTAPGVLRSATVKAYLLTIARNLYRQGLRSERRRAPIDETLPDPSDDHETTAQRRSEVDAVLRGMQELPEADRAALLMRALEGLPYEEIAAAPGISIAAARVDRVRSFVTLRFAVGTPIPEGTQTLASNGVS